MSADVFSSAGDAAGRQIQPLAKWRYRILVVDDEPITRQTNSELLINAGYEVQTANDGAAGWDALQADQFDALITDNLMPKVSGIELIDRLRASQNPIRIIMATGTLLADESVRYPWLKAIAVVRKPFTEDDLLSAVTAILASPGEIQQEGALHQSDHLLERAQRQSERAKARSEEAEADLNRRAARSEIKAEHKLRFSELRYRRLFEAARDGIMILEVETGRISDVNPFLVELLGFSHSEMVGKTVGELSPFKDIEPNQAMLKRLQEHGYVRYEDLPLETRDHRRIAVKFVCNIYQEGDQKVIQCNIRDITERKSAEDEKRRASAELEQRVVERTEELEAFSFSASHDLRVPLLHVLQFVKELREDAGPVLSKKSLALLTTISRATKRMGDLIDDLLDFSRTGLSEMHKDTLDLDALVRECA